MQARLEARSSTTKRQCGDWQHRSCLSLQAYPWQWCSQPAYEMKPWPARDVTGSSTADSADLLTDSIYGQ